MGGPAGGFGEHAQAFQLALGLLGLLALGGVADDDLHPFHFAPAVVDGQEGLAGPAVGAVLVLPAELPRRRDLSLRSLQEGLFSGGEVVWMDDVAGDFPVGVERFGRVPGHLLDLRTYVQVAAGQIEEHDPDIGRGFHQGAIAPFGLLQHLEVVHALEPFGQHLGEFGQGLDVVFGKGVRRAAAGGDGAVREGDVQYRAYLPVAQVIPFSIGIVGLDIRAVDRFPRAPETLEDGGLASRERLVDTLFVVRVRVEANSLGRFFGGVDAKSVEGKADPLEDGSQSGRHLLDIGGALHFEDFVPQFGDSTAAFGQLLAPGGVAAQGFHLLAEGVQFAEELIGVGFAVIHSDEERCGKRDKNQGKIRVFRNPA